MTRQVTAQPRTEINKIPPNPNNQKKPLTPPPPPPPPSLVSKYENDLKA